MTDAKLTVPFSIELTDDELVLLRDSIATELARLLDHSMTGMRFEALIDLGNRLGMNL